MRKYYVFLCLCIAINIFNLVCTDFAIALIGGDKDSTDQTTNPIFSDDVSSLNIYCRSTRFMDEITGVPGATDPKLSWRRNRQKHSDAVKKIHTSFPIASRLEYDQSIFMFSSQTNNENYNQSDLSIQKVFEHIYYEGEENDIYYHYFIEKDSFDIKLPTFTMNVSQASDNCHHKISKYNPNPDGNPNNESTRLYFEINSQVACELSRGNYVLGRIKNLYENENYLKSYSMEIEEIFAISPLDANIKIGKRLIFLLDKHRCFAKKWKYDENIEYRYDTYTHIFNGRTEADEIGKTYNCQGNIGIVHDVFLNYDFKDATKRFRDKKNEERSYIEDQELQSVYFDRTMLMSNNININAKSYALMEFNTIQDYWGRQSPMDEVQRKLVPFDECSAVRNDCLTCKGVQKVMDWWNQSGEK